jgi:hypothetical protein
MAWRKKRMTHSKTYTKKRSHGHDSEAEDAITKATTVSLDIHRYIGAVESNLGSLIATNHAMHSHFEEADDYIQTAWKHIRDSQGTLPPNDDLVERHIQWAEASLKKAEPLIYQVAKGSDRHFLERQVMILRGLAQGARNESLHLNLIKKE